jgi:hypothetical protein
MTNYVRRCTPGAILNRFGDFEYRAAKYAPGGVISMPLGDQLAALFLFQSYESSTPCGAIEPVRYSDGRAIFSPRTTASGLQGFDYLTYFFHRGSADFA